ncbi:MAG: hypothetical protein AB1765_05650, partial [Candidatus Hydrogenedentota bacterium]
STSTETTPATDMNLNETYYWRVAAVDAMGNWSQYSDTFEFIIRNSAPYETILVPVDGETYSQNVVCTYIVFDADNNRCTLTIIQYTLNDTDWYNCTITSGETANVTADANGETHYFVWASAIDLPNTSCLVKLRIRAYDGIDTGSADTTYWFSIYNLIPPPPANVSAIADLTLPDTGVYITWDQETSSIIKQFNIYRSTGFSYILYDSVSSSDTDYLDSGAVQGETYYYRITKIDTYNNESSFSDTVSAPYITLQKLISDTILLPNETTTYTIQYTNNGFAPCTNAVLIEYLPQYIELADTPTGSGTVIDYYTQEAGPGWESVWQGKTVIKVRWTFLNKLYPQNTVPGGTVTWVGRVK